MAEVQWIKIVTDIFDDEKILLIETMPEADSLIVIWFKLLCLAGKQNNSGVFMVNDRIPYTDEMFAAIFRRPINTVRLALSAFEKYGMIEIINNTVTIPNWGKHQSIERIEARREYLRDYQREYRAKQKQLAEGEDSKCLHKRLCKQDINRQIRIDKNREEENREDKNNIDASASAAAKPQRHKHGEHKNVLLSDAELEKLQTEFPTDWERRIDSLSNYLATHTKRYKNHYLVIRNWARKEQSNNAINSGNTGQDAIGYVGEPFRAKRI